VQRNTVTFYSTPFVLYLLARPTHLSSVTLLHIPSIMANKKHKRGQKGREVEKKLQQNAGASTSGLPLPDYLPAKYKKIAAQGNASVKTFKSTDGGDSTKKTRNKPSKKNIKWRFRPANMCSLTGNVGSCSLPAKASPVPLVGPLKYLEPQEYHPVVGESIQGYRETAASKLRKRERQLLALHRLGPLSDIEFKVRHWPHNADAPTNVSLIPHSGCDPWFSLVTPGSLFGLDSPCRGSMHWAKWRRDHGYRAPSGSL
jgi:hypothetical protein